MRELTIMKNDAGQRLDKFLLKYMPSLPQAMLYKSLRKDCVRVNGKHVRNGAFMLSEGDELKLYMKDEFFAAKSGFEAVPYDFDVVYEDENILLVNKAAGVVVHADDRNTKNTLIDQIKSYLFELGVYRPDEEQSFSPALCNRLDRNTAGIIIAAKNAAALRALNEKLRTHEIHKYYVCTVDGIMEGSGTLEANLTRGNKKVSISQNAKDGSKPVRLRYKVLSHGGGKTRLEIELFTGRTHQIRAQLAAAGHPLAGDVKYGGSRANGGYSLTSHRLEFNFISDGGVIEYLNGKVFELND